MKRKSITILIALFSLCCFYTASGAIDSKDVLSYQKPNLQKQVDSILKVTDNKEYDLAIEMASSLINEAEKRNENGFLFHGYNLLSITYDQLQDSVPAFDYAKKALHFAKLSKNDTLIAWGYNNLAASLSEYPETRDQALSYYKESLKIQRRLNDGEFLDAALNIAELYREEENYTMMYPYLKEAQKSYDGDYFYYNDPLVYLNILWGDYYKGLDFPDRALVYYNKAYDLTEEKKMDYLALDFYSKFADFLTTYGKPKQALEVYKRYIFYFKNKEQVKSHETFQLAQAHMEAEEFRRARNDAELKQQILDQDLQRKKTQSVLLGSIIGLMVLFLAYLFYSERLRLGLIKNLKLNNRHLKKAKDRAEKSERSKTKFFSTLSHEMRTPLYGVTGIISILEKKDAFAEYKDEIGSLKFSADHLLDIINDLLDISKLEDDNFELINKPFNVKLLVEELVGSFQQNSLKNSNCKIICDVDSSMPNYVVGDSRRISQILLNILGNAVKFTPKGIIAIRLHSKLLSSGKYKIQFEIEDNGIGIPKEKHESIFDEFSQLDDLQSDNKGTGLGLPIVRKLLNKMGSDIELKSEPGQGSIFSFTIEFAEATLLQVIGKREAKKSEGDLELTNLKDLRILIVDDNKINRLVTRRVLENQNAIIFEAQNGEEALERTRKHHYDMIMMDINMPGMNGYETTKAIRVFDKSTPIIALTAAEASYVKQKVKESGMNDVITKPYNLKKFSDVIAKEIKGRNQITG
ncbi:phospho-acceptor domain-containing protein [Leeuwenhoekiella aestuarii]|uniref:histidine kinase n=1 Tax=Leeuwenhoekiella aestuarii TaxID=2249426 RepID=A0A4Q0NV08_9FLAO|nr:response regulator [Leeuwenhoekiella aestuarii]RXG15394.1 phospho-acceptor domain-containing protein [Leeuwenhoekiella aestuarii]RXG17499.1 phospho-acceptor domain-containing protein [Leeuwenhoekiella aestuarii]